MDIETARTFRPRFNRALSIVGWIVVACIVVGIVVTSGLSNDSIWLLPALAAVTVVIWVALWRPHLAVDDTGVTIANIVQTVGVPWGALIHLDVTYALRVHVPGRAIMVDAAPAPGRMGGAVARRGIAPQGTRVGERVAVGELLTTDSGKAAALIRARWDALRDAGQIAVGEAETIPVRSRIDATAIGALAVTLLLFVASAVLANAG